MIKSEGSRPQHKSALVRTYAGPKSGTTGVIVAILGAAVIVVGGWVGYSEFSRKRLRNEAMSNLEALENAQQETRKIQASSGWEERRVAILSVFDSLSAENQRGFLLTFREAAERSARATASNQTALKSRLEAIASLEAELRSRRK
jgi:hypothetical protein